MKRKGRSRNRELAWCCKLSRQQLQDFFVPFRRRHIGRRFSIIASGLRVSTVLEQVTHHVCVTNLRRFVKRSPSSMLAGIGRSVIFEQQSNYFCTVRGSRAVQWSDLHGIFRNRGDICSMPDQYPSYLRAVDKCGKMQGGESVGGPAFSGLGISFQHLRNPVSIPRRRRFENV